MQMARRRSRFWRRRFTIGQALIYFVLSLVFVAMAYPFFYTLSLAVMPYEEYVKRPVHALPAGFTLRYFEEILKDRNLVRAFRNSILKTTLGTTLNVVFTTMAGYALSRRQLKYGRFIILLFVLSMWLPGGLIPYYLVIRAVGLLNTFWAMVIPGLVGPFSLFMVRAYFLDYPEEVIEAAIVDGAGQLGIFWRIIWPTAKPIIATLALLSGTGHWNDYFWPSILVPPEWQPATVLLQTMVTRRVTLQNLGLQEGQRLVQQSFIAAVASVMIIPILVVYPFLQRYFVRGIMLGAIKG
jgi:putative aldouronate transport system permease protein